MLAFPVARYALCPDGFQGRRQMMRTPISVEARRRREKTAALAVQRAAARALDSMAGDGL